MRKLVKVYEAEQYVSDWPSENIVEFLSWLKEKLEQIPEEFRSSATIEISSIVEYGSAHATLEIYYYRPQTEEEEIIEANNQRRKHENIIQRDIAELERLKKKYGR